MGRKSPKKVTKLKQVAADKSVLNQLAKDNRPNKVFKLVLRLSKGIAEMP